MAKHSKIEWTHHTFNPWWGCTRVSPGCKHCYADSWARRVGLNLWGDGAPRRFLSDAYWKQPLAWDREAAVQKSRRRVFCASMADVFEDREDLQGSRSRLWDLVQATPNLDWLLLTKRPHNVGSMVPWRDDWPSNVWLGTTAENQRWAEKRIPELLKHNAAVLFLSCEPLLGPLNLAPWLSADGPQERAVDWVIAGGESGPRSRAMNPEWVRSLRDQCETFGTGFHFKQWGNWAPSEQQAAGPRVRIVKDSTGAPTQMVNVGKKEAGRDLDGREWDGLPWHV